jgi:hypothetical protein
MTTNRDYAGALPHLEGPPCHPDPPRPGIGDEQDRWSGLAEVVNSVIVALMN